MTKTKRVSLVILAVLGASWLGLQLTGNADWLPPRSAVKVARVVSGLSIPNRAEVLKFTDKSNDFGDALVEIELLVTPQEVARLREEALRMGYRPVPQENTERIPFPPSGRPGPEALYRFRGDLDSLDYDLAVVDVARRRISVTMLAN